MFLLQLTTSTHGRDWLLLIKSKLSSLARYVASSIPLTLFALFNSQTRTHITTLAKLMVHSIKILCSLLSSQCSSGLSFSVLPPTKLPGSLKNIYKQLSTDFPTFSTPKSGWTYKLAWPLLLNSRACNSDLTPVAKLGVLWLNTSLTVRAHKAASHAKKGWEVFTGQVLRAVLQSKDEEDAGVVFMAWGLPAQKTCAKLNINKVSLFIRSKV